MVSVISVIVSQALLVFALLLMDWSAAWSNVFAVGLSALPSYYLNRAWAWGKRGRSHWLKEVVPFWAMAFLGLALSTVFVHIVEGHAEAFTDSRTAQAGIIALAQLAAFGALWVGKFIVLNKVMFGGHEDDLPPALDLGPLLEVGTYCGKSAAYLGAAARDGGSVLFTVDHHRGSEENQSGWEHHDPDVVDANGRMDTLPFFRETIAAAGLEDVVIAVVGESRAVAAAWKTPLAFLFIDGGHGAEPAWADFRGWTPHLAVGGTLAIHDVFENPADGGRPPFELYCHALESGAFTDVSATGSLRVLRRVKAES
jgi:putative flippase GtrA